MVVSELHIPAELLARDPLSIFQVLMGGEYDKIPGDLTFCLLWRHYLSPSVPEQWGKKNKLEVDVSF